MYNILLMVQIVVALGIISLVLIQHGKGADAGAAFGGGGPAGGGASGSVFGSRGAGNFLSRTTAILALVFFMNSLGLAWLVSHRDGTGGSIINEAASPVTETIPAVSSVPEVPDSEASAAKAEGGDEPETSAPATSDVPEAPDSTDAPTTSDVPEATVPVAAPEINDVPEATTDDVPEANAPTDTASSSTNDAAATSDESTKE